MSVWKRLWRRWDFRVGAVVLALVLAAAALAPWLMPADPLAPQLASRLVPPGPGHWLGTDDLGRDLASRLLAGAGLSLAVGAGCVAASLLVGGLLGMLAGMAGGRTDGALMRALDVLLAFPSVLLALLVVAILGPSLEHAIAAIAIVNVPVYARLARAAVLSVKPAEYLEASRAMGAGPFWQLWHHVLPNAWVPLAIQATLGFATAILETAGLSFLGLGAQPPTPEWGAMLNDARPYLRDAWWLVAFPGLALASVVLALNALGDSLRDVLDPRRRGA